MKDSIFTSHETLMDLAQVVCQECHWYGNTRELIGNKCPECDTLPQLQDPRCDLLVENDIDEICVELMQQTFHFNRAHGYFSYRNERSTPATHNAMLEIDMHGRLDFRILDWYMFVKASALGSNYYPVHCEIDMERPAEVSYLEIRNMLWDFEKLWRKL